MEPITYPDSHPHSRFLHLHHFMAVSIAVLVRFLYHSISIVIQDSTQWRCSQKYVKINYSLAIPDAGKNNFYKVFLVVVVIVVMVVMMVVVN